MPEQQFGYIFQSKRDENDIRDTSVRIVNTFNFFYWRLMKLMKKNILDLSTRSTAKVQDLAYTQIPNGQTYLHLIMKNEKRVKEMFEIAKKRDEQSDHSFYLPLFKDNKGKTVLDYLFGNK